MMIKMGFRSLALFLLTVTWLEMTSGQYDSHYGREDMETDSWTDEYSGYEEPRTQYGTRYPNAPRRTQTPYRHERTTRIPSPSYYFRRPLTRQTQRPTRRPSFRVTTIRPRFPVHTHGPSGHRHVTPTPTPEPPTPAPVTLPPPVSRVEIDSISSSSDCRRCVQPVEHSLLQLETKVETLRREKDFLSGQVETLEQTLERLTDDVRELTAENQRWRASLRFPGLSIIRNPSSLALEENVVSDRTYTDCQDAYDQGEHTPGVYSLQPSGSAYNILAYCQDGWTILQRRFDGSVDFYRNFSMYLRGFGNFSSEFWLGLENMHQLTRQHPFYLRIDMESSSGTFLFAAFSNFEVHSEVSHYAFTYDEMVSGNAGDGLEHVNNTSFSTRDHDEDNWPTGNCAAYYHSGFWLDRCGTDLNRIPKDYQYGGLRWNGRAVKSALMRIKPARAIVPKDLTEAP